MNENIFKNLVAYLAIAKGENPSTAVAVTGALFILPFLCFSHYGGYLADRYSKQKIAFYTRIADFLILSLAFVWQSELGAYTALVLLSTSSALFGPSKYGIIPELVSDRYLLKANSFIAAFTFLAIIFGTALASLFTEYLSIYAVLPSIIFAFTAIFAAFFIKPTSSLRQEEAKSSPFALFCFAYLLFVGGFVQLNIVPYSITSLGLQDIDGGYLFFVTSLGIAIGAFLAKKSLFFLPLSLLLISVCLLLLGLLPPSVLLTILLLGCLGILGGLFLVPSQVLVMTESGDASRGRSFGSANFLSFVFALLAAGVVYLFEPILHYSAKESFLWVALINCIVGLAVLYFWAKRSKR